ncbi:MAG: PHP domain-containing protein [Gemmatimonadaceae bacterium]
MTIPRRAEEGAGQAGVFVDLHMHSTASDGSLPPDQVVAAARTAGLAAIALTDHDTVAGIEAARAAAVSLGVRVSAGVELSAFEGTEEMHILGLHLARLAELDRQLVGLRAARRVRAERIVERLNALGVGITMDAVARIAGDGAIGRPHIARALVRGGFARDQRDAFDRYLGWGRPAFVEKQRLSVSEALGIIHGAGGIAVLAHPGVTGTRARLQALAGLGLDGVEVLHPSHSAEDIARLGALADHLGLVRSGGSDWHGAGAGDRVIGGMRVPFAWLEPQEARARQRLERAMVA